MIGLGQFDVTNGCQMSTVAFVICISCLKDLKIIWITYLLNLSSTKVTPHKKK